MCGDRIAGEVLVLTSVVSYFSATRARAVRRSRGSGLFWSSAAELPPARRFNCTTTLLVHFVDHLLQETPRETP